MGAGQGLGPDGEVAGGETEGLGSRRALLATSAPCGWPFPGGKRDSTLGHPWQFWLP